MNVTQCSFLLAESEFSHPEIKRRTHHRGKSVFFKFILLRLEVVLRIKKNVINLQSNFQILICLCEFIHIFAIQRISTPIVATIR